jgi:pimeloyl-ACP methyl ester carboxylesterase
MGFLWHREPRVLDSTVRATVPGQFVELSDGTTHYELAGPLDGHTIVLIHGFFNAFHIWDASFEALVEAGFRVLRYDLFGRGYSDRPHRRYTSDLFDRQVLELLARLGIESPVDVVGGSMGGAIALIFADRHPETVRRLCLIDPSGYYPPHARMARLIRLPGLGELFWAVYTRPERFSEEIRNHMAFKGHRRALLSTVRHGPFGAIAEVYERVGRQERPTMLIWGREDEAIPLEVSAQVLKAIPHAEFRPIDGAGHKPQCDRPDVVNPLLIEFLGRQ